MAVFFKKDANLWCLSTRVLWWGWKAALFVCVNTLIKENAASIICNKMNSGMPARSGDIMSKLIQQQDITETQIYFVHFMSNKILIQLIPEVIIQMSVLQIVTNKQTRHY